MQCSSPTYQVTAMRLWLTAFFFVTFAQCVANGASINNTHIVRADKNGGTVVCNQYIGQGAETREAIKNLDEKLSKKLDQLIKLLQPSPTPGKNVFSTIRSNSQCSFLFILS